MDALVAHVAVAGIPKPVPVVVKTIAGERLQGRGAGPEIVMHARRNRLHGRVADGVAPLVAKPARHVDVADQPSWTLLDALLHRRGRADLRAVLDDAVVFLRRAPPVGCPSQKIVRAGLLHVNVLARLARPDGHQRVPVIGRGDRNGIDRSCPPEACGRPRNVCGLGMPRLHERACATRSRRCRRARRSRRSLHVGIIADVIHAAPVHAANRHAHAIVRAQDALGAYHRGDSAHGREARRGACAGAQKIPASVVRIGRHRGLRH